MSGVRSEYRALSDDAWRRGRARVLRTFLGTPAPAAADDDDQKQQPQGAPSTEPVSLFRALPDRVERQQRARVNMQRELEALSASV